GDMADVIAHARLFRESDIALHHLPLALRAYPFMSVRARVRAVVDISAAEQVVHLAMRGDDLAARLHAEHRLAHESLALHSPAVVGKADDVGRELLDGGEFLPPLAHGERGVWVHPRLCGAAYRILLLAKVRETVRDGTEFGHRKERRIARSRAALVRRRDP